MRPAPLDKVRGARTLEVEAMTLTTDTTEAVAGSESTDPRADNPTAAPEGASAAAPVVSWSGGFRADVTFGLPSPESTREASRRVRRAAEVAGLGWTERIGVGGWQGNVEPSVTISIVAGRDHNAADAITTMVAAAQSAGCVAVQVETWSIDGYAVMEYRP